MNNWAPKISSKETRVHFRKLQDLTFICFSMELKSLESLASLCTALADPLREPHSRLNSAYFALTGLKSLTPRDFTFQMSSAYSVMVLSLENLPDDATFKMAMVYQ